MRAGEVHCIVIGTRMYAQAPTLLHTCYLHVIN
jgi:hypothetical protein